MPKKKNLSAVGLLTYIIALMTLYPDNIWGDVEGFMQELIHGDEPSPELHMDLLPEEIQDKLNRHFYTKNGITINGCDSIEDILRNHTKFTNWKYLRDLAVKIHKEDFQLEPQT